MAGTIKKIAGPAYLASSVANIYTPPADPIYTVIRHIHVANVSASPATFTLYVGATGGSAAGTQLFPARSVSANDTYDYYCGLRLGSTQFLTGVASAVTSLTITVEGEVAVRVDD